jgi:hypothetical protein
VREPREFTPKIILNATFAVLTSCRILEPTFIRSWYLRNKHVKIGEQTIETITRAIHPKASEHADRSLDHGFERRMRSSVGGRRLATTEKGYLGLVDEGVCQGDQSCIFLGGRMPVILRPMGDCYHFIGECYFHGLMFGKAVEEFEAGGYQPKKFVMH